MKYKDHIFDVGAFNGLDGLILALKNKDMMIHAFEANPFLIKLIKKNKKKIEKFKNLKIKNYIINNLAVSNKDRFYIFNIAKNPTVSSLKKFSSNIDKTWPGYREQHCTFVKKVKIRGITLKKYCKKNNIDRINYLHIDTQGNDLNVLKGLDNKIHIVQRGVLEASISKKKALYQNNHTINETKKFLENKKFTITKILPIDENIKNEKNIFFSNQNINYQKKVKNDYKLRYFYRIINDKLNIKDKVFNKIENFFVYIIKIIKFLN